MTQTASGPVILCVLDGWGNAPKNRYNAISNAKTPVWDKILKNYHKIKKINPKKNCVIGFGITEKTISKLKSADGLVVGSAICKEITRSLNNRQNPVTNVSKVVARLKNKIL